MQLSTLIFFIASVCILGYLIKEGDLRRSKFPHARSKAAYLFWVVGAILLYVISQ